MKVNYVRLFVDVLLMGIIPLVMLLMGVVTYVDVNRLEKELIQNKQEAAANLGEYTWETAMVNYVLEVEFEMQANMKLTTLGIAYIFLSMMEGMIFFFVFKNFQNGRYFEVE